MDWEQIQKDFEAFVQALIKAFADNPELILKIILAILAVIPKPKET